MTSFNITGFSSTGQAIGTNESGFVATSGSLVTGGTAVAMLGSRSVLAISGSVVSTAVGSTTITSQSINSSININGSGFVTSLADDAMTLVPTGSVLVQNAGTIQGFNSAIKVINTNSSPTFYLINSGDIQSRTDAVRVAIGLGTASISNSGTIVSAIASGIEVSSAGTARLTNSGVITSNNASYESSGSTTVDLLKNSGEMFGSIFFGENDDTYLGIDDGFVAGTVFGQNGSDLLRGASADDDFDGGLGSDTLRGGGGDDMLDGGGTGDLLVGGDGDDTLLGEGGIDVLRGGDGNDDMDAGSGDDNLTGGNGDDTINGGTGKDTIKGGSGEDTIIGGRDQDVMSGGAGPDVFVFEKLSDSTDNSKRDKILDFAPGEDVIDISALNGSFDFVGYGNFSGTGKEVRLGENAAGNSTVYIDFSGNGNADMRIVLTGATGLTEGDFIL